jgi:EAL domain-containing protein (putative c-di-GMP-specific phosphodiesterase class I)
VVSVEALGRWNHSLRGEVPPGLFIESLEQNGLINKYTYWAIATALEQAMAWDKSGHHLRIAVNVSPQTLMSRDFVINLHRLIKDESYGRFISFEITENLFLSEYDRLSEVLEYICFLGITLSIDDYGTGYSSLSRLRKLPVSEIKIDQSFVKEMTKSVDSEIIVRSTIDLAHNLGLLVVAEGVEQREALDLLKELGCDIAQGYLFSKPVPADELEEFIKAY